jgi:DNA-binding protein HU-beta
MVHSKTDMVATLAREAGIPKERASAVLDALTEGFATALASGQAVDIFRLGRLTPFERKARKGLNLRTGEPVAIPPARTVKFAPAPALKARLNPEKEAGAGKLEPAPVQKPETPRATGGKPAARDGEGKKQLFTKHGKEKAGEKEAPEYHEPREKMFDT